MFENWEVSPVQWTVSSRAAIWGALVYAFGAGVLTGLLWAGRLPFDLLRIVSLAILLAGAILMVLRFALPRIQR
jgi:hypothetical protein